ncbi:MAG: sorbosone dehydrogenase family protein [Williamsia sp.]|nr:sorbosone dehydrogenase family protein [Williamsia sp.]
MHTKSFFILAPLAFLLACQSDESKKKENAGKEDKVETAASQAVELPAPYDTKSAVNYSDVTGWPAGKTPLAPQGFQVTHYADSLLNPRWIYTGPNGDVFVCESNGKNSMKDKFSGKSKSGNLESDESANRITLFRDANGDGVPEMRTVFLTGLNHPFGMLIIGNSFYVANTDGVVQYPYQAGQTKISASGKKLVDLPTGKGHWTRTLLANKEGTKIYIGVGSGSNVGENGMETEVNRAAILQMDPDGSNMHIYASGLRNPQGMGWAPGTTTLWTAVNERDELGDDLVPDYFTSVQEGGFYGWPYSYWGQHEDPRLKDKQQPDLVKKAIVPDVSMGAHTASLGLAFDEKKSFPGKWAGGAFIGQHGSWNRAVLSGYKVVFVPFRGGKPSGPKEDFLTGFVQDSSGNKVYGRPVGVAFTQQGDLLVADDASNVVWRVSAKK